LKVVCCLIIWVGLIDEVEGENGFMNLFF